MAVVNAPRMCMGARMRVGACACMRVRARCARRRQGGWAGPAEGTGGRVGGSERACAHMCACAQSTQAQEGAGTIFLQRQRRLHVAKDLEHASVSLPLPFLGGPGTGGVLARLFVPEHEQARDLKAQRLRAALQVVFSRSSAKQRLERHELLHADRPGHDESLQHLWVGHRNHPCRSRREAIGRQTRPCT
jgi:hypothetical protein